MQIETFKIFCDLAETGSFSKAAARNNITQSAVSQQLRALEQRFQAMLVDRGHRTFQLTGEGAAFLQASREILDIYDHLGDRLSESHNAISGEIKVAAIYSIGLHDLPPYLRKFRQAHPNVDVQVRYRRSPQVYAEVLSGEVDFGLAAYPVKRKGLIIEPFRKDRLVVICHPAHQLARKQRITLKEIHGEKFISFEPDMPTRKVIDRDLRAAGVTVERAIELDNIETVKRAVEIEHAVSIVPEGTVAREVASGALAAVEIVEPQMWRPLGILLQRHRPRTQAQRELVALLQKGLSAEELASLQD